MPSYIPQPAPYPIDAFLLTSREAGAELIRNVGAPDALIGMGLINAISMACQGLIDVKMPTGQVSPVSQNLLMVAESGERKSTVYSLLLKPFRDADAKTHVMFGDKVDEYQAELASWQAEDKAIRRAMSRAAARGDSTEDLTAQMVSHVKAKPKVPRLRYFMRQDITAKAIMEALEGDGESIGITTDEGHLLFQSAAMSNLGLLNRLWDSPEVVPLDRAKKEHVVAMNPRVSVSIMTQEAPLRAYLDKRGSVAKGSGHWARYLVGWPTSTMGYRWVNPSEQVWEHLPVLHARITELLDRYRSLIESGKVEREIVEFSDDAKARWFDLVTETEHLLRRGEYLSDINDFAAKIMEILARLAAAMHYFGGEGGKITLDTLNRAFTVVRWHVDEYKVLFSPQFTLAQDQVDAQAIIRYLRGNVWCGSNSDTMYPKNMLLNRGPVRDRARLNPALELLEMQGAVQIIPGGKRKKLYVRLMNHVFENIGP